MAIIEAFSLESAPGCHVVGVKVFDSNSRGKVIYSNVVREEKDLEQKNNIADSTAMSISIALSHVGIDNELYLIG